MHLKLFYKMREIDKKSFIYAPKGAPEHFPSLFCQWKRGKDTPKGVLKRSCNKNIRT